MWKSLRPMLAALVVLTSARLSRADAAMDAYVAEVVRDNPSLSARALRKAASAREASASALWPDPSVLVMVAP